MTHPTLTQNGFCVGTRGMLDAPDREDEAPTDSIGGKASAAGAEVVGADDAEGITWLAEPPGTADIGPLAGCELYGFVVGEAP